MNELLLYIYCLQIVLPFVDIHNMSGAFFVNPNA